MWTCQRCQQSRHQKLRESRPTSRWSVKKCALSTLPIQQGVWGSVISSSAELRSQMHFDEFLATKTLLASIILLFQCTKLLRIDNCEHFTPDNIWSCGKMTLSPGCATVTGAFFPLPCGVGAYAGQITNLAFGSCGSWSLFELKEDWSHASDILGIAWTLWVEVTQTTDSLPLTARLALVSLLHERLFVLPATNTGTDKGMNTFTIPQLRST